MDIDHIGQLHPDPRNARKHNPRNIGMVVNSLQEVGAARSIVIDEKGNVLAGNGTIEAAAQAGIERVHVVDADGETIVAVRRSGLSEEQKKRLALFDNRTAELAGWDVEVLQELSEQGDALEGMFSGDELDTLLASLDIRTEGDGGDEFDTTPQEGPTRVQRGELWRIGEHRLLCGDATSAEDVGRLMGGAAPTLMVTDPPYGVEYDANWRNVAAAEGHLAYADRRVSPVQNDDRRDWTEAWRLFPGDVAYCWYDGRHASEVQVSLEMADFEIRCQIIWAKSNFPISRGHYHWRHEPCWYAVKKGRTASWIGDRKQTTLWEINLDKNVDGGHSTQKPMECMIRPIRNHSGDVYDPFLGSGTTLIAAHRTGRKCYGLEIEPKYCDVILRRAEAEGIGPIELVGNGG